MPILLMTVARPVESGLVVSLARPGGNATGLTMRGPELNGKRLELLKEAVPAVTGVAVLWDSAGDSLSWRATQLAAAALGVELQRLDVNSPDRLEGALAAIGSPPSDALFMGPSARTEYAARIAEFAMERRLPAIGGSNFAAAGALMGYGVRPPDLFQRAATYVDRIFRGIRPLDMPVEEPARLDLVVNLKTAHALGITVPPSIMAQATEVLR